MHQGYRLGLVGVFLMIAVVMLVFEPVTVTTETTEYKEETTETVEYEEEWLETETETFVVEYKDGYEDDATYVGEVSENAYAELQETFPENVSEPSFEEPIHIRVYPGAMWNQSDYVLRWKDTTPVRIHVLAPSDSDADDDWYEHGLAHELANMFLWNEAGQYDNYNYFQRNPSWFPEGLSEYYVYNTPTVEDQFPPSDVEKLKETIAAGDGDFSAIANKQYDGGHILSMYLIDEYSEDAVWNLLRNDAYSWSDAVEEELGVTQAELERNWYRWAEENIGGDYSDRIDSQEEEAELEEKERKMRQLKTVSIAAIAAFGIFIVLYFMKR